MLNLEQDFKIKQSVQNIAANGAHKVAKWADHNGYVLFAHCNISEVIKHADLQPHLEQLLAE